MQVDPEPWESPAAHLNECQQSKSFQLLSELQPRHRASKLVETPQMNCDISTVSKGDNFQGQYQAERKIEMTNEARQRRKACRWAGHMSALRGRACLWPEPSLPSVLRAECTAGGEVATLCPSLVQ